MIFRILKPLREKDIFIILVLFSLLFFIQGLNIHGLEYRDDEIFYYRSTQEMVQEGNYLSPTYFGEDRFQKPILFYWLIMLSYGLFGLNWFAARFVAAVAASLTVGLTWRIGSDLFNRKVGFLSALILMTLPLFFRHAKNAVPDMFLDFFIVLALYCSFQFCRNPDLKRFKIGFFISCALGFMIKGFAAIVIPFLGFLAYCFLIKRRDLIKRINFSLGIVIILAIVLPWFIYMAYMHGENYVDYMLKAETLERAVSLGRDQNPVIKQFSVFKNNFLFYIQAMMSYFAPWSIFVLGAVPWAVWQIKKGEQPESLWAVAAWFLTGFLFFSMIFTRINHLILVITTPFVILLSCFLLYAFDEKKRMGRLAIGSRKLILGFILTFGLLGIVFLRVFLLGSSKIWIIILTAVWLGGLYMIKKDKNHFIAPLVVCLITIFVYSQAGLLSEARLTTHASLQGFADKVQEDIMPQDIVAVGSHDIHEKEWQVYFNCYIRKAATSNDDQTKKLLDSILGKKEKVYCLILKSDFEKFLKSDWQDKVSVIRTDKIFRRRIHIDKSFFKALARLDQEKIGRYFLEELVLVVKDKKK